MFSEKSWCLKQKLLLPESMVRFVPRVQPIWLARICIWWSRASQILSPVILLFKGQGWWFGLKYAHYQNPPARDELGAAASAPCHREQGMRGASHQDGQAFPSIPCRERWGKQRAGGYDAVVISVLWARTLEGALWPTYEGAELCSASRATVRKFVWGFFFVAVVCLFL